MTDGDDSIEEKRVYGESAGATDLLVAAAAGVVRVRVADGRVGEFGVGHRCAPAAIAADGDLVAVATDEDVLLGPGDGRDLDPSDFGPAVAVGIHDGTAVAAAPDGRLARHGGGWDPIGEVDGDVRAIDGSLVGTEEGVYRLGDGISFAGLSAVRDVSATGIPLAATERGLYALGNGWMDVLDGDVRIVDSDGDRAHAATADALFERRDGAWAPVSLPTAEAIAGVAYADCPYAITRDGTLLSEPEPGEWREYPLGLSGAVGVVSV